MQDPLKPTLTTFRKSIVREARLGIRTMQPAKIVTYSDVTSTATIELAHQTVERGKDGNTEVSRAPYVLQNVPVLQLGGDDAYLRMPIVPGSTGLALISDRSIAAWRVDGNSHPPPMPHTHNLGDCVFLAGVRADSNPLPPATMGGAVLEAAAIQLGIGATQAAVLGNIMDTLWSQLVTYVTTHTHAVAALPAPGVPPANLIVTLPPTILAGTPFVPLPPNTISPALSDKVFVE
jgi:hypothetical protein